jgi:hypothetical protein
VWRADLAPVAITLDDDPAARPALLLVMAGGFILSGDVVSRPSSLPADVASILANGIRTAIVKAGYSPRTVQVRYPAVAKALVELLAPLEITVRAVPELPDIDDALHHFDQTLVGRPPELGPRPRAASPQSWAGWGLSTEQVARFFSAAAAYYRAAPWTNITNEDIVRASIKGGGRWSATVMGMAGELYGLALYARHEDLLALVDGDLADPGGALTAMKGTMLSMAFDRRHDQPKAMQKEVRAARWEVAGPSAYPSLIAMNTPGGGISAQQMEDLITLLGVIPKFADAHEPMLSGSAVPRFPIRWRDPETGVSITFEGAPGRTG